MESCHPGVVSDALLSYLLSDVKKHTNKDSQYDTSTPNHFSYQPGGVSNSPDHPYQITLKKTQANKGPQFLCFLGQLTGGDLVGATWSIGNSSAFDSTVQSACPCTGILGCLVSSLTCTLSNILDKALGTAGFGMAQTHNSFEADSSIMSFDYTTGAGLDASVRDPSAVQGFWNKQLPNGTWDDPNIWIDWAYTRMQQGIQTNPCYFRVPQATLLASLGAYAFTFKILSNHTQEIPAGTMNGNVLSSFFSFQASPSGTLTMKGQGKEQIPNNW
jgi:Peroxidase, family 2